MITPRPHTKSKPSGRHLACNQVTHLVGKAACACLMDRHRGRSAKVSRGYCRLRPDQAFSSTFHVYIVSALDARAWSMYTSLLGKLQAGFRRAPLAPSPAARGGSLVLGISHSRSNMLRRSGTRDSRIYWGKKNLALGNQILCRSRGVLCKSR